MIVITVIIILCFWWGYRSFRREHSELQTLPAKAGEIEKMVKLSSLEIVSEEIFKDTINIKAVVSRVKAKIYIGFDIEHIPMTERGDTLFVQLPRETIEAFEATDNGYQILDVWNTQMPDEPAPTPLSTDEENIVKRRIKQRLIERTYERGYVRRARANALRSLAVYFSRFKDNVIVIDRYPDGWKEEKPMPAIIRDSPHSDSGLNVMP